MNDFEQGSDDGHSTDAVNGILQTILKRLNAQEQMTGQTVFLIVFIILFIGYGGIKLAISELQCL